jgi:hypothetical protein
MTDSVPLQRYTDLRVTDGARTRDLRSRYSGEVVPVCRIESVESADLQVFQGLGSASCPLRAGVYRPACSVIAVNSLEQIHSRSKADAIPTKT